MSVLNHRSMKTRVVLATLVALTIAFTGFLWDADRDSSLTANFPAYQKITETTSEKFTRKQMTAIGRSEYEVSRIQDPRTGRVPVDIRRKELQFASRLPASNSFLAKGSQGSIAYTQDWTARGPYNVGGRTRALAVDLDYDGTSNRRILAGGTSGGMYLSEDGGQSWQLTTSLADMASVTTVAQDPSDHNVWYYGTGEHFGLSAAGGGNSTYLGHGIFKSTDGGESWTQLESTIADNNPAAFDTPFDIVWRIVVDDDGVIYAALRGMIVRSEDGGQSWEPILVASSDNSEAINTDLLLTSAGALFAAVTKNGGDHQSGVFMYLSEDDWFDVTPPMLDDSYRMQLAASETEPGLIYLLVQTNEEGGRSDHHQLLLLDTASLFSWTDLSLDTVIPTSDEPTVPIEGGLDSQGGYDLLLAVHPQDSQTIWIGGTSLFRSEDAGASFEHVGGYDFENEVSGTWENHWVDQHAMAFIPGNPDQMLSGNDGGVYRTDNNRESPQTWTSLNDGYITSQFYSIAVVPDLNGDETLVGGLQDRGNWAIEDGSAPTDPWEFLPVVGDGGVAHIAAGGGSIIYLSTQQGNIIRADFEEGSLTMLTPSGFEDDDFLFITPYVLDPNDTNVMYVAVANGVARNSDTSGVPTGNEEATDVNWTLLENSAFDNVYTTALRVTTQPEGRLYVGGTDFGSETRIIRVDDPENDGEGVDITPSGVLQGSYVSDFGINPEDGNELVVVLSNYGVPSIFHSSDGGSNWTDIEGNLSGDDGPSVRKVEIIPTVTGPMYLVATSTGLYGTSQLDGSDTVWEQQGADVIGNVVVDALAMRASDGFVAAASHGRGTFAAYVDVAGGTATDPGAEVPASFTLEQNYPNPFNPSTTIQYELSSPGSVRLSVYDAAGRILKVLEDGVKSGGSHQVTWNGTNGAGQTVASGTYFYRLTVVDADGVPLRSESRPMVFLK